ncbi:MAG: hypothetical protein PUB10_04960, partial [Clostridiales bacterium]|nr:hypothetical protein [Clostridiales bacterium]
ISGTMKYPFEHVGTWFCVFCKTLVPLRVQWSESEYFMVPDILRAFGGCAPVTAELLLRNLFFLQRLYDKKSLLTAE